MLCIVSRRLDKPKEPTGKDSSQGALAGNRLCPMTGPNRDARYRGPFRPNRRWEVLRRQFAIGVLCIFVSMASFYVIRGLLIGEIPLLQNDGLQRVVTWDSEPSRFVACLFGWLAVAVVSAIGIRAIRGRIRDIQNP